MISDVVLREIAKTYPPGSPLAVGGFSWLGGAQAALPRAALTSKVLCEHHNKQLAGLDAAGGHFFSGLHEIDRALRAPETNVALRVDGHAVELWLLKTLLGAVVSGNASNIPRDISVPREFVDCLFAREPMPATWGLYFLTDRETEMSHGGIQLAPICDGRVVHGLLLDVLACRFVLVVHAVSHRDGLLENAINRLEHLVFVSQSTGSRAELTFDWAVHGDGGTVTYSFHPGPWMLHSLSAVRRNGLTTACSRRRLGR